MLLERIKLEDDEKMIVVVRKHWWIIFTQTVFVVLLALAPLLLQQLIIFSGIFETLFTATDLRAFLTTYAAETWFLYTAWLLILLMILANFWTDFYLDLWAITNRRVVLVDQRGFFRRFISSFRLERLQDMNIEVNGVIATLLDYGTIEAQTAGGSNEEFISKYMPKPRDIKATIVRAADDLNQEQRQNLDQLKEQGL